ncbi:MAG: TIGR04282 family arsenosugar biosynthesis glycosyltransferase [Candidatus Acidiferrales bacterium]
MERRALLIFADSAHTDCQRRGWPATLRFLLETQIFSFEGRTGVDVHLFTSRGLLPLPSCSCAVHIQEGVSFGQRLENAIGSLARSGYHEIVVIGRDCPDLEQTDICEAFELIQENRLVIGPDHRGGCYLIGIHANDRKKLHGIRWQRNTDFRQILDRFGNQDICQLPVKLDLDSLRDVWLLARSQSQWKCIAKLLRNSLLNHWSLFGGTQKISSIDDQREYWQFPPPLTQAS